MYKLETNILKLFIQQMLYRQNGTQMNKYNKWCKMVRFLIKEFDKISSKKKGFISIIDIWDTEFKLEKKFNVRSKTSQKLSSKVMLMKQNGGYIIYE